jgi:hypothetical protein
MSSTEGLREGKATRVVPLRREADSKASVAQSIRVREGRDCIALKDCRNPVKLWEGRKGAAHRLGKRMRYTKVLLQKRARGNYRKWERVSSGS